MLDFHDELGHPNATITVMCIGFGGDFGRGSSQFGISLIYIFSSWRCLLTGVECWATTGGKNRGKIYSWGWYSPAITFAPSPVRIFVWPTYLTEASLQKEIHIALGVLKCFVVVRSKVFFFWDTLQISPSHCYKIFRSSALLLSAIAQIHTSSKSFQPIEFCVCFKNSVCWDIIEKMKMFKPKYYEREGNENNSFQNFGTGREKIYADFPVLDWHLPISASFHIPWHFETERKLSAV